MSLPLEFNSESITPYYMREFNSEPSCCEEMCNKMVKFFLGAVVTAIGTSFALIGISALAFGSPIVGSVVLIAGLAAMIFGLYVISHACNYYKASWQL